MINKGSAQRPNEDESPSNLPRYVELEITLKLANYKFRDLTKADWDVVEKAARPIFEALLPKLMKQYSSEPNPPVFTLTANGVAIEYQPEIRRLLTSIFRAVCGENRSIGINFQRSKMATTEPDVTLPSDWEPPSDRMRLRR